MAKAKASQGKAKAKQIVAKSDFSANPFGAIEGMDGNPNTPQEFDDTPHDDEEMYFNPSDEATDADKKRCKVLNFIHRCLKYNTQRVIPAVGKDDPEHIEIYHRESYMGETFEVCVYFPLLVEGGFKECVAIVKLLSTDLEDDECMKEVVSSNVAWTPDAQKDKFTLTVDKLARNYWAPRWKYVVKYLCERMAHDFDKYGIEVIPEKESEVPRGTDSTKVHGTNGVTNDSGEIIEEVIQVFSGSKGMIIGPKGSKIHAIKDATHVEDIKMPDKDGPRLRARELVDITIKGTQTQINQAKEMIQAVVDEWANAPRPARTETVQQDFSTDYNGADQAYGGAPSAPVESLGNWADDANEAAASKGWELSGAAASNGGGDGWGAGDGAGW